MIGITNFPNRYFVCDREKLLVYGEGLSNNHVMAVNQGLINGLTVMYNKNELTNSINLNDPNIVYRYDNGVFSVYNEQIPSEWLQERTLVLKRLEIFARMQDLVYKRLSRIDDHIGVGIMEGFVWSELNKCKPDEGYYTHAIEEWAHITDTPIETAYQELLIRSQGIGLVVLRTQATYLKYVTTINQCKSIVELEHEYKNFFDQIYKVAKI